jgi:AraC family transcriptional regulator
MGRIVERGLDEWFCNMLLVLSINGFRMPSSPWQSTRKVLRTRPVISAEVGCNPPLWVERYFFQARRQQVPALRAASLVVHLGGARASGGRLHGQASNYIPSFSVLVPADCPSEWFLEGPVDIAVYYFSDMNCARVRNMMKHLGDVMTTYPFTDSLISAAALQMVSELGHGKSANHSFVRRLGAVIVDQTERVLAGRAGQHISPDRLQLGRLRAVLEWINRNLSTAITNSILADQAGLGESHFRHMFGQAMGTSPSRYVQQQRLERARVLLNTTNLPIANVAAECGFVSQSYLTTCFRSKYGITPARFRRMAGQLPRGPNMR